MLKSNSFGNSRRNAFTLMEVLIAVIIVGILASIALTKYAIVVEKSKAKEGEMILNTAFASLKRYEVENPGPFPANPSSYIDFIAPKSNNFYVDIIAVNNYGAGNSEHDFGVSVVRKNGPIYSLSVDLGFTGGGAVGYYALTLVSYGKNSVLGPPGTIKIGCTGGTIQLCSQLGY